MSTPRYSSKIIYPKQRYFLINNLPLICFIINDYKGISGLDFLIIFFTLLIYKALIRFTERRVKRWRLKYQKEYTP